jgi:hypothetical protein
MLENSSDLGKLVLASVLDLHSTEDSQQRWAEQCNTCLARVVMMPMQILVDLGTTPSG